MRSTCTCDPAGGEPDRDAGRPPETTKSSAASATLKEPAIAAPSATRKATSADASLIIASPSTSIPTRSGTCMRLKVACRRYRVGRRDDRAEHERGRPAQAVDQLVRGDRDARPSSPAPSPSARHGQRPQLGAQLARRGVEARRGQQRRQEDEEHDVRVDDRPRAGPARRPRASPTSTSAIGYGTCSQRRAPHQRGGPEQEQEQELEVGHVSGRVYDRTVPASLDPPLGPDDHVAGDPADAPYELVMYGDFECPYCAASQSILARVRKRLGRRAALRVPPPAAGVRAPARAPRRRGRRGGGRPGRVLGDARRALRRARQARGRRPGRPRALGRARRRARRARARRRRARGAGRARRARRRRRSGSPPRPAFFVNGVLHTDAYDAGSLVAALRALARGAARRPGRRRGTRRPTRTGRRSARRRGEPAEDRVVVGDLAQVDAEAERHHAASRP